MGYACPVCEDPQADQGHLANHLAFTALLRGGDHERWLDEHVPDWETLSESTLAERVVDDARAAEYPQVFEDTTGERPPAHGDAGSDATDDGESTSMAQLIDGVDFSALREDEDVDDADLDEIIAHAKELTRHRRTDSETE